MLFRTEAYFLSFLKTSCLPKSGSNHPTRTKVFGGFDLSFTKVDMESITVSFLSFKLQSVPHETIYLKNKMQSNQ